MRILITGITSALGTAVADHLRGHEVIGLAREQHPRYPTLLRDLRAGARGLPAVDVCLHMAFVTDPKWCREHRREAYRVNVLGTKNLLNCAGRFVFVSSGSVYGFQDGLCEETRRPEPADEYAAMKLEAEQVVASRDGATVLRYFYPYGPGTKPNGLVNRLIRAIATGAEVQLHKGGRPRVNPIYLSDLVAATKVFCLGDLGGVYNVAGPEVVSVGELAALIGSRLGKAPVFRRSGTPTRDLAGSTAKLAAVFRPGVDLRSGLETTLDYFLKKGNEGPSAWLSRPAG